jgi:hypothetical protein
MNTLHKVDWTTAAKVVNDEDNTAAGSRSRE